MSYLRARKNAFYYAFKGLLSGLRQEPHLRLHALAAMGAVAGGVCLSLTGMEWMAISTAIGLVLICELFNTAIERTCDLIDRERNEHIRYIKDISAAAVLVASILSVVIGCLVFLPHLR